jgi:hypothetical protein
MKRLNTTYLATGLIVALAIPRIEAADMRDPMKPPPLALYKYRLEKQKNNPPQQVKPAAEEQSSTSWQLNSILYSGQRQHAIINNQLVRKGGSVDGARLVRIEPDSVRLVAGGKPIKLVLPAREKMVKKSVQEK